MCANVQACVSRNIESMVALHGQECMAGRLYDKCCLHSMGGESAKQSEFQ